jgi:hypothetical protein
MRVGRALLVSGIRGVPGMSLDKGDSAVVDSIHRLVTTLTVTSRENLKLLAAFPEIHCPSCR